MFNPNSSNSLSGNGSQGNNNKPTNRSIMLTCNADSLDSISELVKKVYTIVTPRCLKFPARIRKYGTKNRKNVSYFITFPKTFIDYIFNPTSVTDSIITNGFDITFYYDKNLLKKVDQRTNRDEMFVLMKITRKPSSSMTWEKDNNNENA